MKLRAEVIPYSSVVGGGVTLHDETGAVVGQLLLRGFTPNPRGPMPVGDPYKEAYVACCERIAAAINAGQAERQVRHVKRDTIYDVLPEALFQVSEPTSTKSRGISDGDPVTVYRNPDGKLFVRFPDEMVAPRFVDAAPEA